MSIKRQNFGTTAAGDAADLFTLSNSNGDTSGIEVAITNFGGIIQSIRVPDKAGNIDDIALGYESLAAYEICPAYFGCVAGRYANRIANGRFALDGVEYLLERNNGAHHLHGGSAGFNRVIWRAQMDDAADSKLTLTYVSADGEGGYPGQLTAEVCYSLTAQNELRIDYRATTDKPTILNLTNHSYFNLLGQQHATEESILNHQLMLNAEQYIPTDSGSIPLGPLADVSDTPMDFRTSIAIGARIDDEDDQLKFGKGFDHTWVLNKPHEEDPSERQSALSLAARIIEPTSGRLLEVYTTEPGVQFYTGNHISDLRGKGGVIYESRSGFCLETQHFPDSPNQPNYPSTILRPEDAFHETTLFRFGTTELPTR